MRPIEDDEDHKLDEEFESAMTLLDRFGQSEASDSLLGPAMEALRRKL